MNILYIAYSCSPYNGSEDKIGWSIPATSARNNKVFVITKEEQRKDIEKYLSLNKIENISFFYVDIPNLYKKIFKGFLFSGRLNIWHKRAMSIAKKVCFNEKIDVIHQITPVEFRSIGSYAKIPNIKFVCGPIGGGQAVPKALKQYTKAHTAIEAIRSIVNNWYRFIYKLNGKLRKCDYILFANYETKKYLNNLISQSTKSDVITDIAIDKNYIAQSQQLQSNGKCRFLVAGRLVYLKGHEFLLDALERLPKDLNYECRIVGAGPECELLKKRCSKNPLLKNVIFAGSVPYNEMEKEYENADVLVMPSFREATGSVILEAMAKGLPVITINKFGGAAILDDDTGWLYSGKTKEEYLESLKTALVSSIMKPDEVLRKGENAKKYAEKYVWENKVKFYQSVYETVVSKEENRCRN